MNKTKEMLRYKAVVAGIKDIVSDGRGRMTKMDAFDAVIADIFGVEHLSKRLNNAYSNREMMELIDRVGLEIMYEVMVNKRLRGILTEMVDIDKRIHELRKVLRKQGKKGRRDKDDLKEYNWLRKTFKESSKYMRNRFGIKSKKSAYKRRYKNIVDLVKKDDDYDYDFDSFGFNDDFDPFDPYNSSSYKKRSYSYMDDYDDDDDFDEDEYSNETSALEDFERMINGHRYRSTDRKKRELARARRNMYDLDEDDDDDEVFVDDDLEAKVDEIAKAVMSLTEAVQFLNNKSVNDSARIRNLRDYAAKDMRFKEEFGYNFDPKDGMSFPKSSNNPGLETELGIVNGFVGKLSEEVVEIKKTNKLLAEAMDKILEQNANITEAFNTIFADDDDYNDIDDRYDVVYEKPQMVKVNELDAFVNRFPDVYAGEVGDDDYDPNTTQQQDFIRQNPGIGDIIDQINHSTNPSSEKEVVETVPSEKDEKKLEPASTEDTNK